MGRKEENVVARIEGGVLVVDPKPQNGVAAKAIDWLEWAIIKLMNDSTKPLPFLHGNFEPTHETPPLKDLPVKGHLPVSSLQFFFSNRTLRIGKSTCILINGWL